MIVSAQRAANSCPRGDPPAWQIGGRPCGERGAFSGAAAFVIPALVIDRMHFAAIREHRRCRVEHDGVGLPRIP